MLFIMLSKYVQNEKKNLCEKRYKRIMLKEEYAELKFHLKSAKTRKKIFFDIFCKKKNKKQLKDKQQLKYLSSS